MSSWLPSVSRPGRRLVGDLIKNRSSASSPSVVYDRFVPVRSGMDLDVSRYLLTNNVPANLEEASPYQRLLAEAALNNRTRILAFNNKPPQPPPTPEPEQKKQPTRCVRGSQERPLIFDGMMTDELYNLLDWGKENVLATGIQNLVCFWNVSSGSPGEFKVADEDEDLVTSVCWSPDGRQLAVGLHGSRIQLWDVEAARLLRTLSRSSDDASLVGSLAWCSSSGGRDNNNILASGGIDTNIEITDMRSHRSHVGRLSGHFMEVCRLQWSGSGTRLASGGLDGLVHVWDVSMTPSSSYPPRSSLRRSQWLHRFEHHKDAVTGLAWCPFKTGVLASGGGVGDMSIAFWDARTGTQLNSSLDAGSQVSSLRWNIHEPELLSSHGAPHNQVALWKYPAMEKTADLVAHTAPVLWTAMSPDGCTVASLSPDEGLLLFWDLYEKPKRKACQKKTVCRKVSSGSGPFSSMSYIR